MNFTVKKLLPLENNYELIFGVLVIPIAIIFYTAITFIPTRFIPTCRFHEITGLPCPTCGATRAAQLLSSGKIIEAWLMQPLLTTVAFLAIIYSIYSFVVVLGKLPRIRLVNITTQNRNLILLTIAIIILINWIYLALTGI